MIIGIDPGVTGGIAAVSNGKLLSGIRTPILKHGKRDVVDTREITRWLPADEQNDYEVKLDCIVIEQVSAMPQQGLSSTFNFGRHTGAVEGWALEWRCPVHWVTPAVWKKAFGLSKDKQASLDRARLEFGADPLWTVKRNDGIAEAALLALYWHRHGSIASDPSGA